MTHPINEAGIRTLVFTFYDRIQEDPVLGPMFERRLAGRWEPHLEKMCDFWSTVLLGTARFRGNPMVMHMDIPGLMPEHFDRWIALFDATAHEVLPTHQALDIVGRSKRMRVALERAACPAAAHQASAETAAGSSVERAPESAPEPVTVVEADLHDNPFSSN